MEEFARRISIQAEGTTNVLVIELTEGEMLNPYCCKIMERNNIPGLLRMRHQSMDGVISLRYSIGGKVPLREFMVRHRLSYEKGILLLRNLSDALLHLDEYFLSTDMCYLDTEHIYVGDGLCVYLPCIPLLREDGQNSSLRLKKFYEMLLSEYFATEQCSSYDEMFKWVYKTSLFDLKTFYAQFLKEKKMQPADQPLRKEAALPTQEKPAVPVSDMVNVSAKPQLKDMLQDTVKKVQERYTDSKQANAQPSVPTQTPEENGVVVNVPGGRSFQIPGMPLRQTESKKVHAEKDKKGFWPFASRAVRDKQPDIPAQTEQPAEVPVQPQPSISQPVVHADVKPASVQPSESNWEDGTILVDSNEYDPLPLTPSEPKNAYFIHNGQKVIISQTPFLVGKYNTTCRLHYAIYDNNKVSRSHATFLKENGQYFIRDNQSRNGTLLNGKALMPLKPTALKDGDEICLYDELLTFHLDSV